MVSNKGLKPEFVVKWPGSSQGLLQRAPSVMQHCSDDPSGPFVLHLALPRHPLQLEVRWRLHCASQLLPISEAAVPAK